MSLSFLFWLWGLLLQPFVYSQILSGIQIEAPGNFSTACNATFHQKIACSPELYKIASGLRFPTLGNLSGICTDACLNGLETLRQEQLSDCRSSDLVVTGGATYPPTYTTDLLLFTYNYTCLKDPATEKYCSPDVFAWNSNTTGLTSDELCSDCNLLIQQAQLDSPLGYDNDSAISYSSLTSSCGVTKYPISSQPPYSLERATNQTRTGKIATATAAYPCKSTYTIQPDDTCQSVSESHKVATFYLMQANNLPGFPGPPSVIATGSASVTAPVTPIPTNLAPNTTRNCGKYYKVVGGDDCASISASQGISLNDLLFLNPMVNSTCGNLLSDMYYCVEAVGNIATYSGYKPAGTRYPRPPCFEPDATSKCFGVGYMTTPVTFSWPPVGTQPPKTTSFPRVTPLQDLPLAPGTPDSCSKYTQYYKSSTKRNINECGWKAWFHSLNVTQFISWNPSLSFDRANVSACVLLPGYRYCIREPGTTAGNYTTSSGTKTLTESISSALQTVTYYPSSP
ncbi:carbohydrate-binding module family 50 protein [Trichoderma chlorosporum]